MGFPRFRFTLNNTTAGSLQISEPGGWDESVLKLERNQEYHSLVEFFDQPLMFYGQNSEGNGGLDYIREIEKSQGPDAQITILIEITFNEGSSYTTVFNGLIDITSCKEIDFYKAEYGIIRDDFWQKFINRKSIKVDLGGATDLDGNAIAIYNPTTLSLPSQSIRQVFERDPTDDGTDTSAQDTTATLTRYLFFSNNHPLSDEITERFEYGTQITDVLPTTAEKYLFKVTYDGSYNIIASIAYAFAINPSRNYDIRWYYAWGTPGALTTSQFGASNISSGTTADSLGVNPTLNVTVNLSANDEIYIWGTIILNAAGDITYFPSDTVNVVPTSLEIIADTTYVDTTTNSYQILRAAKSIASKLTGLDPAITSTYLGASACGGYYGIAKGFNIRGGSQSHYLSFDDFWNGINPILNLGLGYTLVGSTPYIEIEQKDDFYDPTQIITLDFVNMIERSYYDDGIFKSIEIGYEKWQAESGAGVYDVQTKRVFRTRFKTVGRDLKMLSKFIGAASAIEQTRRNRIETTRDWRMDEDTFIIALDRSTPTGAEQFLPSGSAATMVNATTMYNIRISATRNLLRWKTFLNGCLKWYTSNDDLTFSSGEGAVTPSSTLVATDCEYALYPGSVGESGDFDAGAGHDFLFVPITYSFEHSLTWSEYQAIRDNRKKAIGISRTNTGHVTCFILSMEYQVTIGKANFTVLLGQSTPL